GWVTNSCRYSRARALPKAGASSVSSSRPASAPWRARVLQAVSSSVDRYRRVEGVVEVLRANIQPLRHQTKLRNVHPTRVRASGARRKTAEELGRQTTIRTACVQVGADRLRDGLGRIRGVNYNDVVGEQQLLIRDQFLRHRG